MYILVAIFVVIEAESVECGAINPGAWVDWGRSPRSVLFLVSRSVGLLIRVCCTMKNLRVFFHFVSSSLWRKRVTFADRCLLCSTCIEGTPLLYHDEPTDRFIKFKKDPLFCRLQILHDLLHSMRVITSSSELLCLALAPLLHSLVKADDELSGWASVAAAATYTFPGVTRMLKTL